MKFMKRAIDLAKLGTGKVNPNPLVGAVIVKNNKIIGEGYHKKYGDWHAEVNAFNSLTESADGAEMYVTLEPCSHYGKTPPCALAVAKSKIKKIYIGMVDPNPRVAGKGIEIIKNAGIQVEANVMEKECREINQVFLKYITTGMPYVVMKNAVSLDGKIATYTGSSKWISNEESRNQVQLLRNELTGIMVGINTVLSDNPYLTCRIENGRNPYRIIVDSQLRISLNSNIIGTDGKCIVATISKNVEKIEALKNLGVNVIEINSKNQVNLNLLMLKLGELKIDSILLEGGGTLNFSALQAGIVDKAITYISPKIIGGVNAKTSVEGQGFKEIKDCVTFTDISYTQIKDDIVFNGYIRRY